MIAITLNHTKTVDSVFTICILYSKGSMVNKMARRCDMDDKVWRLTVFLADGREMTVALYKDEGEALTDALLLAEDERVFGYRIEPVK